MAPPPQSFLLESVNTAIQLVNGIFGSLDRRLPVSLGLPSLNTFSLFLAAPQFCRDPITYPASLGPVLDAVHDELHATCLASSILLGTMLAERFPFVISAQIKSLVEEAHFGFNFDMSASSRRHSLDNYLPRLLMIIEMAVSQCFTEMNVEAL